MCVALPRLALLRSLSWRGVSGREADGVPAAPLLAVAGTALLVSIMIRLLVVVVAFVVGACCRCCICVNVVMQADDDDDEDDEDEHDDDDGDVIDGGVDEHELACS